MAFIAILRNTFFTDLLFDFPQTFESFDNEINKYIIKCFEIVFQKNQINTCLNSIIISGEENNYSALFYFFTVGYNTSWCNYEILHTYYPDSGTPEIDIGKNEYRPEVVFTDTKVKDFDNLNSYITNNLKVD